MAETHRISVFAKLLLNKAASPAMLMWVLYKSFTNKQTKTKTHSKAHCLLLGTQHSALGSSCGSSVLNGGELSTPRRLLTVFAVRAHCLVMVSVVSNKSLSAKFHSSHLVTWCQKSCASSPFLHGTLSPLDNFGLCLLCLASPEAEACESPRHQRRHSPSLSSHLW